MNSMPRGAFSSQEKIPSGYKNFAVNQYTPEQQGLFGDQYAHLGKDSFMSRLAMGDQSGFDEMEAPALRQFGELQGNIASRFSGMGMGGRRSSGFQNTMNQASQDFAGQLQSKRQDLRRQAISDLMGMSNTVLGQRPQERGLVQKPKSFWENLGSGLSGGIGQGIGQGISSFFGG